MGGQDSSFAKGPAVYHSPVGRLQLSHNVPSKACVRSSDPIYGEGIDNISITIGQSHEVTRFVSCNPVQ